MKCNQSDFKIFIFRLQIYIILIHLLEIPIICRLVALSRHKKCVTVYWCQGVITTDSAHAYTVATTVSVNVILAIWTF